MASLKSFGFLSSFLPVIWPILICNSSPFMYVPVGIRILSNVFSSATKSLSSLNFLIARSDCVLCRGADCVPCKGALPTSARAISSSSFIKLSSVLFSFLVEFLGLGFGGDGLRVYCTPWNPIHTMIFQENYAPVGLSWLTKLSTSQQLTCSEDVKSRLADQLTCGKMDKVG